MDAVEIEKSLESVRIRAWVLKSSVLVLWGWGGWGLVWLGL
jgi:hypothetical protein